ncbi:hypothetical protein MTO96_039677 [Rhipicephalus appendiculatus]
MTPVMSAFKAILLLAATSCVSAENRYAAAGGGFAGPAFTGGAGAGGGAGGPSLPPQPYSFGYDSTDEFGTQLFHKEQGDASNAKTGSYGYRDANGLFRTVTYVADANGFRATIDTNEPGTAPGASADAVFNAKPVAAPAVAPGAGRVTPRPLRERKACWRLWRCWRRWGAHGLGRLSATRLPRERFELDKTI